MIDLKPTVRCALIGNAALVELLGGKHVYQGKAPQSAANHYPRITFFELNNFDSSYADNEAVESEISMQVDVWHIDSTSACATEVDRSMKELGFKRFAAVDLEDHDGNNVVFHKALRYRKNIEIKED